MRWFLDPTIKVLYIDRVIAIFADGGLSSNADLYFDSQKPFLYAFHGRKTVPIYIKLSLVFKKLLYAIRRRNLLDIKTAFSLFCYLLIPPTCLSR